MAQIFVPSRVVIAGGSGALGQSLARHLVAQGVGVTILSRSSPPAMAGQTHVPWDARTLGPWGDALEGADALVNLVGRSVDCIKTPDHCDEILRSRVEATRVLGRAMRQAQRPPGVWVQMSTAHAYGDPPEAVCDEGSALGYGLAPSVAQAWEGAFHEACHESVRGVVLRTSFVLARQGGAMTTLTRLAKLGLGARVGHGRQGISWIHELDMNRLFQRAITEQGMRGVYVVTSPTPVPQAEFMRELRRVLGVPIGLPAFAWMVRLGAPLFFRTDPELALFGRYCVPTRLAAEGFEFRFPTLAGALEDLYARRG